jgi:predicted alpha/beta hydrolase
VRIAAADGQILDVRRIPAVGERRGIAVLGHAMMVDRRSLDRPEGRGLGSSLAARGWEVWLADLRGHGRSGPTPDEGGSWTYDDIVALDLPALVGAAKQEGCFVWLVGHSLAGHASIAAAGCGLYDAAPDGHVLLAANTWVPELEPSSLLRRKKGAAVLAFRAIRRIFGRFPSRRLKVGPADEAGPYVADIARFWRDGWRSRGGVDYFAAMGRVEGPVLNVVGRGDRLYAAPDGARAWTARIPGAEFWLVGRGERGLDFDPDHMTLASDERARPLWDAIADWMERRAPRREGAPARIDAAGLSSPPPTV